MQGCLFGNPYAEDSLVTEGGTVPELKVINNADEKGGLTLI